MIEPSSPTAFYTQRIRELNGLIKERKRQFNRISWLRLLVSVAGIAAAWLTWDNGWQYVAPILLLTLAAFLKLVSVSARCRQELNNLQTLLSINQEELQVLDGQYTLRFDGSAFQVPHHPYAQDLDILGKASLFQYLHRTTAGQSHQLLANWLLQPADRDAILARQEAAKELSVQPLWRQQLQAYGTINPLNHRMQASLNQWLAQPQQFISKPIWKYLRIILPAISLAFIFLYIIDVVQAPAFYGMIILFLGISSYFSKLVTPQYAQLSKHVMELQTLGQSLNWLESINVEGEMLKKLKERLKVGDIPASSEVKRLKNILDRMDLRLNPLVFLPLNIFLFWDLQQILQLEKWKARQKDQVDNWFMVIAEMEALSSLANLAFNQPAWTFPVIRADWFKLSCTDAGHPLIPSHKRVDNSFGLEGHPQLAFITGSNMAGKSTFLRTIGINLVLAMTGAPVCASAFETPVVKVMTSMRIADNLEESASTFYAELQKLKAILDAVKADTAPPHVFLLLDEILRGTNSLDRHTGSEALIRQLIKEEAAGIIASHDLSLAELQQQFPNTIHNYHFDVTIEGNELHFDYRLKQGVCRTLNATLLMKKIGIEI
jgi:hypothetical protein